MTDQFDRLALSRRTLIALAGIWLMLFAIAGAAASGNHTGVRGTVDSVVWSVIWLGLLALIVLAVIALLKSRQSRTR